MPSTYRNRPTQLRSLSCCCRRGIRWVTVTQAMVTGKVTPQPAVPERQVIEDNATQIASVRISHRKDIARARSVAANLLTELELQTGPDAAAMLADLGELMRSPDDKGQDKLAEIYQKVISLPGRVKTMKDLGDSMRVLIGLEREAYGIEGDDDKSKSGAQRKRVILDFVDVVAK